MQFLFLNLSRHHWRWLAIGWLAILSSAALAQETTAIVYDREQLELGKDIRFLEDADHHHTLDSILAKLNDDGAWQVNQKTTFKQGYSRSTWWLHFPVHNIDRAEDMLLQIGYPLLDTVEVWLVEDSIVQQHYLTGDNFVHAERPVSYRNFIFPIVLPEQSTRDIILRIESSSSIQVPIRLWAITEFWKYGSTLMLLEGIGLGILLFMVIYNLAAGLKLWDSLYFYYVAFLIPALLTATGMTGMAYQYFWPTEAGWNQYAVPALLILCCITSIEFIRRLTEFDSISPRLKKILNSFQILQCIALTVMVLAVPLHAIGPMAIAILNLNALVWCFIGIYTFCHGKLGARYYLLGWTFVFFGLVCISLKTYGYLPSTAYVEAIMPLCILADMMVLAYALAARINQEREKSQEKDRQSAQALAEAKARSQFIATISHEIRTPMNGIIGVTELLNDTELNSQQQEYIELIQQSGNTLVRLINDVLDFSKIDAGEMHFEQVAVDIKRLAKECLGVIAPIAERKNISSHLEAGDVIPEAILTDPIRIRQVLINLLGNAVKFTEQGSITLTLGSQPDRRKADGILITFSVRDTGIGMNQEQCNHVFEEFHQADSSTTRRYGGTGLGLSISKRILELMGGGIAVTSLPNQGSTFSCVIPTEITSADELQHDGNTEPAQNLALNILVAEDNPTNQIVIKGLLKKMGASYTLATNGEEALHCYREQPQAFDLILMDCEMPIMDGYQATREIRQFEQNNSIEPIAIIAASAHALDEHLEQSMAAGMSDHLSKPITSSALRRTLAKLPPRHSFNYASNT